MARGSAGSRAPQRPRHRDRGAPHYSLRYDRSLQLIVRGEWLTSPITVMVGPRRCLNPQLRDVTNYCWMGATGEEGCLDFGSTIMCTLTNDPGVQQVVSVTTGRGLRRQTIDSLPINSGPRGLVAMTLSSKEPSIGELVVDEPHNCSSVSVTQLLCGGNAVVNVSVFILQTETVFVTGRQITTERASSPPKST